MDHEEVLALEGAVLWQVRAVDGVLHAVPAEAGAQGVWTQVLGDLWVHGSAQGAERLNGVLLTHLHNDAWASGHLLANWDVFWQHASVDLQEFLSSWFVEIEHLHGGNLKSLLQHSVDHITSHTGSNNVWLDHNAGAVVEDG